MKENLLLSILMFLGMFGVSSAVLFICGYLFHRFMRHIQMSNIDANQPIRTPQPRRYNRPCTPPPSYRSVVKSGAASSGMARSVVTSSSPSDGKAAAKDVDPPAYREALCIEAKTKQTQTQVSRTEDICQKPSYPQVYLQLHR